MTTEFNSELYRKDIELSSPNEIETAFKNNYGYDLFGERIRNYYYYTEGSCIIKIQDKFYKVTVEVTMAGKPHNTGDDLYEIHSIDKVTYVEVDKSEIVNDFNNKIINEIKELNKTIDKLNNLLIKEDDEI